MLLDGVDILRADKTGIVPFVLASMKGIDCILRVMCSHLNMLNDSPWFYRSNSKSCSFFDAYFEKESPFHYLIWNMLLVCPDNTVKNSSTIRDSYQTCILLLIESSLKYEYTQKFIFPYDNPPDAFFTCLELAILKKLDHVIYFLFRQTIIKCIGDHAMNGFKSMSIVSDKSSINLSKFLFYLVITSKSIPEFVIEQLHKKEFPMR